MRSARFWITDPRGHRLHEEGRKPEDGSLIDTVFGEAVVIRTPLPPGDMWVCDLCSEEMLTRFGADAWPVAMLGGYALCLQHMNEAEDWPDEDNRTGEPIPGTRLGLWPLHICACPPCTQTAIRWLGPVWSNAALS